VFTRVPAISLPKSNSLSAQCHQKTERAARVTSIRGVPYNLILLAYLPIVALEGWLYVHRALWSLLMRLAGRARP
jgi:hypothetical protein